MSENSENIEAKLCAYVEGDLDEAGRVEIERHLEQHPNHRRLLAELKSTRELLRFLPREKAPSEIAEAFNERLERSALLDTPASEIIGATPTENLIPRFLAMAAIVILTAGLAVVVYFALPRGESGTQIAMPTSTARSGDAALTASPSEVEAGFDRFADSSKSGDERMSKKGDGFGFGNESSKDTGATTLPSGEAPIYVVVFAESLPEAVREVTSNLEGNQIHWEPADERRPEPLNLSQSQVALARAVPASSYAKMELDKALVKKRVFEQNALQQVARPEPGADGPAANAAQEVGNSGEAAPTTRPTETTSANATEIASAGANRENSPAASAPAAAAPARESKVQTEATGSAELPAVSEESGAAISNLESQQQPIAQSQPADKDLRRSEQVAAIRTRMTRTQVAALGNAINNRRQSVELIADDTNLQTVNLDLQQRRVTVQSPQPATDSVAVDTEIAPDAAIAAAPPLSQIESADVAARVNPAKAASNEVSQQSLEAQRRQRAMKVGPRAAGGAQEPPAPAAAPTTETPTTETLADEKLLAVPPAVKADKTEPMTTIRRGSSLTITIDELASPDTDKTTTVSVQRDGTIRLPKLQQPLTVDGMTRLQAEATIADAYKSAAVIDSPTVTIEVIEPPPVMARNGRPMDQKTISNASVPVPTAAPSTASVVSPATQAQSRPSTTAPSIAQTTSESQSATTQSAEESLDVVILVSQQGQSPTTEPATTTDSEVPSTRESDVQN